ncbi:MAG: c-type cytochrome domain-containing protein, partial [Bacteroidota bacterium]
MQSTPDWILFFGRFHPLIVHFPIGLLVMGGLLAWLGRKPKWKALKEAVPVVWLAGAIGATFAVILGLMLAEGGGYDESTLDWHKWLGIGVAVLAWGTWALRQRQKLYIGGLVSCLLLLLGAGHNGGNLTHGSDYLVQYAPNPVRAMAGLPPKAEVEEAVAWEDAEVFAHVIQPMLKQRCVSCHNPSKIKGGLRMDTREMLLAGGDNGPIWVAGNVDESEIIHRLHLPKSDDKHMPPSGKTPLSDEQIEVLEWWIAQGANMDNKVASVEAPESVQAYFASQIGEGAAAGKEAGKPQSATSQIDMGTVAELSQIPGVIIQPVSQTDALWQIRVLDADSGLTSLEPLLPIAANIKF